MPTRVSGLLASGSIPVSFMIELVQIAVAALIAGALDTIVGFGGGLLLLPVLVSAFGSTDAVILSAFVPLGWNIGRLPLLRRSIDLRTTGLFAAGIVPGAFLGGFFLGDVNPDHLGPLVLVALGFYHVLRLYVEIPFPAVKEWIVFPVIGLIAGGISGLLGAGNGPLQSWSMSAAGIAPKVSVAVNGALGLLTGGVRLAAYGITGMLHNFPWLAGGIGFVFAILGSLAGIRLSRRTSDSTLKLLIGLVIIIGGIRMFF